MDKYVLSNPYKTLRNAVKRLMLQLNVDLKTRLFEDLLQIKNAEPEKHENIIIVFSMMLDNA